MSNTRVQRTGSAGRWLIPLLLALIILGVLAYVVLHRNAHGSAHAGTTVVITATPAPGSTAISGPETPVPGGAVPPTATPGGTGISTPVPGGTPPPRVPGLQLGMITYRSSYVATIQHQANAGNTAYRFYLDPIQVAEKTLPHYGFTTGFVILSPATASPTATPYVGLDKRNTVKVIALYRSHKYAVYLKQPATQGPKGIWLIVTITQA
ncbi:MAG TPA: hypothetical protein VFB58_03965 [Chloroflexota bacterium]|nr:hypothetical protein [Chloroflexota bacterium]